MELDRAGEYRLKEMEFELFCDARRWHVVRFNYNPKNNRQYVGHAMTRDGVDHYLLITEKSQYYQRESEKKWNKIDYVLNKGEESDVCSEA